MNKTYKIEGMHCSACAASVEKILKRQPAVEDASVNLVMEEAVVSFTDGFDEKKAMQAVEKGGFHMKERDAARPALQVMVWESSWYPYRKHRPTLSLLLSDKAGA